jgi:glycosyltransferase involved in cell wall biosynthesis
MKILFYNHTGQVSGAESVLLSLLEHLTHTPLCEPVLCCPPASALREAARKNNVRCLSVPEWQARFTWQFAVLWRYLLSLVQVVRVLRQTIKLEEPVLIHANSVRAGLVAALATLWIRVPVVWHVHDVLPRHPFSVLIRALSYLKRHQRILAVSHAAARPFESSLWQGFSERPPVRVIHNGVAAERFFPDAQLRRAARQGLGYHTEDFVIGTVGQITPRKGQLELVKAFASIARQVPQARLLIVGAAIFHRDNEYLMQVQDLVHKLQLTRQVKLTGPRNDIAAVWRAFDLAVINSRSDPFPLTMLEAMACGVPVLATSVDGIPEMITHLLTGWLVPPNDQTALTQGLLTLLQQPSLRAKIATSGRRRIQEGFTREHFVHDVMNYYRELSGVAWWVNNQTGQLKQPFHPPLSR